MKKFFTLLVLMLALSAHSQTGVGKKSRGFRKGNIFHKDSIAVKLANLKDSVQKTLQDVKGQNDIAKNIDQLLNIQKENEAKKKRGAMIRIGIGVALLVVLVIGLRRKTAQKK
jgi:hypothetical protein